MVSLRARFDQPRANKRLGRGEEIAIPRAPVVNKEDRNVRVQCFFCLSQLLVGSLRAQMLGPHNLRSIFCSPFCKLKSLIKGRDPERCWIFTRPGFVWNERMFSFRALCYELHFHETPPHSRDLFATCSEKRCSNPLHVKKRIRVISFDP